MFQKLMYSRFAAQHMAQVVDGRGSGGLGLEYISNNLGEGGRLVLCSHNIRRMRDANKKERVLTYYQNKPNSILFLQETYTVEGDLVKWENIWKGSVILSHGTANSRGVAILFHKYIKVKIDHQTVDEHGRYIFLEGQINDNDLALLNYYAPTSDKIQEQTDMIEKIQPYTSNNHHKLILAGNLNCWLQPNLEKHGKGETTKSTRKLIDLLNELNLIDVWRTLNPDTIRYKGTTAV